MIFHVKLEACPLKPVKLQLAQLIVNAGGVAAVIDYVGDSNGNVRLPGIMMLGYVAAHSENLAMAVIVSKGVVQLAIALQEEQEDHIQVNTRDIVFISC